MDRIRPFVDLFNDHITGVFDNIGIIAHAADQRIGAETAVEHIARSSTDQGIVQLVSNPCPRWPWGYTANSLNNAEIWNSSIQQCQMFDVGR